MLVFFSVVSTNILILALSKRDTKIAITEINEHGMINAYPSTCLRFLHKDFNVAHTMPDMNISDMPFLFLIETLNVQGKFIIQDYVLMQRAMFINFSILFRVIALAIFSKLIKVFGDGI